MKKLAMFLFFSLTFAVCSGEVIFVPGWFTQNKTEADYVPLLKQSYPVTRFSTAAFRYSFTSSVSRCSS